MFKRKFKIDYTALYTQQSRFTLLSEEELIATTVLREGTFAEELNDITSFQEDWKD
jgi:hypothetical protein